MQEAAKDLVNVEEEVMGEEHVGERRVEDDVGEGGGPLTDDEEDAGEGVDGAFLVKGGVGDKLERALEMLFGHTGVGKDAGISLNGEEQGGARTEEVGGAL